MKVLAENRNLIKDIRFEYPELMNDDAKESIKEEYYHILKLEEELDEARESVRNLEKTISELKQKFKVKQTLFTIEFEDMKVEQVDIEEVNLSVINSTDARKKTYNKN